MDHAKALRVKPGLLILIALFLAVWVVVALFPLFWIAVMSFKVPLDALSSNPLNVLFGPRTLADGGGVSPASVLLALCALGLLAVLPGHFGNMLATRLAPGWPGRALAGLVYVIFAAGLLLWLLPAVVATLDAALVPLPGVGVLGKPVIGVTLEHYRAVWVEHGFYRNFINSMIITFGVVVVSLTIGTLAGYGLARAHSQLAFWLLIISLIFRALPHSVLVTGYLPPFLRSREILMPLWDNAVTGWFFHLFSALPPTLYGQPLAIIIVLVSINQPFTIWMMKAFFQNIPTELDEAARVDGCTHFGAFVRVIMPVMWPGVITTGLFSFLLAYNDYLVTALLLDAQSQTMVPAITQFLNRDTRASDQIEAIAAAVSIIAPLFVLVMVFQKQLVSGLTQGAVKG